MKKSCENCIYQQNIDAEWPCSECNDEYNKWTSAEEQTEYDPVNRPKHYNREGAMECIDEMLLIFGKGAVKNFCKCNAWKYRYRAADKNGAEDLAKSDWYLNKYKELCAESICKTIPGYLTSTVCLDKLN